MTTPPDLLLPLARHPHFRSLTAALASPASSASLSGLTPTAKALYLTLLYHTLQQPILLLSPTPKSAEAAHALLLAFHALLPSGHKPIHIPALDVLPGQDLTPHSDITEQRATGLFRIAAGKASLVVAPVASALLRTDDAASYRHLSLTLRQGDELPMDDLARHLASVGYSLHEPVEMEGEFSIRGGIFDIFPAENLRPIRLEFFGDSVESIRRFDPATQRSVARIDDITILPLTETADAAGPFARPHAHSLESLFKNPIVVFDEPDDCRSAADKLWARIDHLADASPVPTDELFFHFNELLATNPSRRSLTLSELSLSENSLHIPTTPAPAFRNNIRLAIDHTRQLLAQSTAVAFCAPSPGEVERLHDIFSEYDLAPALLHAPIPRGAAFPDSQLVLIGYEDLFEASDLVAAPPARSHVALFTPESLDLKPGDFVVHAQHGIGKFLGVRTMGDDGRSEDFMLVEYAADSKLYVPLTRLDLIQKYRGAGEAPPAMDKLGGVTWAKTKSRVKAKMRDMAEELLKLYAQRKMADGFSFSPDSNWTGEFEDSFEYSPTRDQVQASSEIKRDMEASSPMDRLLCGDVGFGKTEVAMRAAFKALGDGKQVAILAPTTVLALQHYETFKKRFQAFPVRIEMLSRFRNPKEIKATLAELTDGKVDVVIGTHRVLSKDVIFPDLGLLVIDEEQRFGVRHKERLKQLRQNLDVLTMSATPIPRTLHMALLGLRDMSVIETPPKDRLAVHTVVAKFQPEIVRAAIEQELSRNGQVYFIHNRVESIWSRAASIQELVPNCRVSVGHGQMGEEELEKVLLGFMHGECDVFVCTTIAENGLDIPRANTIIIENSQNYGLSELYQLRGRVGRSNRRAYAYLLVPEDGELTEVARKRLAALKEFSDLGAGFKIAALDLELRGAGNLLGGEQSGHLVSVGYETYLKLLDETARELRGEQVVPEVHSTLNLGVDIRIPHDYIADEQQRLRAYKRIADAGDPKKAQEVIAELQDRYGAAPPSVHRLAAFSQLKSLAQRSGIESIERRGAGVNFKFHPGAAIDPHSLMRLVSETNGAQFTPAGVLRLPTPPNLSPEDLLSFTSTLLATLSTATPTIGDNGGAR